MKFEHKLYLGLGVFFAVIVAFYCFWSGESGGSTLILASALLDSCREPISDGGRCG
jgi:hypothetical protein